MGDSAGAFPAVLNNQATPLGARYSVYLLYWYKVQILTQLWGGPDDASTKLCARLYQVNPKFACFTGTKVQILTLTLLYTLYWYKSANSDANVPGRRPRMRCTTGRSKRICTRRVSLTSALIEP